MGLTMLDLNGDARRQTLGYGNGPVSRLPRVWIGFILAFGFLAAEIVEVMRGNETAVGRYTITAAIFGWSYWFFCIHRFHKILGQLSPHVDNQPTYPIPPRQAVGYHFIPFYNLFWVFEWTKTFVTFLNQRTSVRVGSAGGLGTILLFSMIAMRIDGFLGLSCLFGFALYISRKLRRAVAEHEAARGAVGVFG